MKAIAIISTVFLFVVPVQAKYSGGIGTADDPYQIATAEDLILLGETPEDYDKHFILTADIDLDPNLPGRKVFDRAVVAPDTNDTKNGFQGPTFTGVFDGQGHTISNLTITGREYLGLFGQLSSGAKIFNLDLEAADVNGSRDFVGGLVGCHYGRITNSYSTGRITGVGWVGGLVGSNWGNIATSYSTCSVAGNDNVGGLVGSNWGNIATSYCTGTVEGNYNVGGLAGENRWTGSITGSHSTSMARGRLQVGGLVGDNEGGIATSYSTGTATGDEFVGGLVGLNGGNLTSNYSTAMVTGNMRVGGLVGFNGGGDFNGCIACSYSNGPVTGISDVGGLVGDNGGVITMSFWDMETSGQSGSMGGTGLTTKEMQDIEVLLSAGWDFVDETDNGTCDYWQISPEDYPRLRYLDGEGPVMPEGLGTPEQPYLIRDARDLGTMWLEPIAHYRLEASLDLSGITWSMAVVPCFGGAFDGSGHTISHLTIMGGSYLGLFGQLCNGAKISNLGLDAVNVNGIGNTIGGLAGENGGRSSITTSYSTGTVGGMSYAVGGLVGSNLPDSSIAGTYSTAAVNGDEYVGGLVGWNSDGTVATSYSTGRVRGSALVGGLVGRNYGSIASCFWDMQSSGQVISAGGTGRSTAEMKDVQTFLNVGWDFTSQDRDPPEWIMPADGYPLLAWEYVKQAARSEIPSVTGMNWQDALSVINTARFTLGCVSWIPSETVPPGEIVEQDPSAGSEGIEGFTGINLTISCGSQFSEGSGTVHDPYQVKTVVEWMLLTVRPEHWDKHVILMTDLDMLSLPLNPVGQSSQPFSGSIHGNGHVIRNAVISPVDTSNVGLIGYLRNGTIENLGLANVRVNGTTDVGGLVGQNGGGMIFCCYASGSVTGYGSIGGLVGNNSDGIVSNCYASCSVTGFPGPTSNMGLAGLVGSNSGLSVISNCYATGAVSGSARARGLVGGTGSHSRAPSQSDVRSSFWDIQTSGQNTSEGGTGLTTAEMQTASIFLDAGWDFMDETANGTEDIWWILEGKNYPRLRWELVEEQLTE